MMHAVARLISQKHHLDPLDSREALNHHHPTTGWGEKYITTHSKLSTVPSHSSSWHYRVFSQTKVTPGKPAHQWPVSSSRPTLEPPKSQAQQTQPLPLDMDAKDEGRDQPCLGSGVCLQPWHEASTSKPKCPSIPGVVGWWAVCKQNTVPFC